MRAAWLYVFSEILKLKKREVQALSFLLLCPALTHTHIHIIIAALVGFEYGCTEGETVDVDE
jgi:hypothetical protein